MVTLIGKKLEKGLEVIEIAELVEEPEENVRKIVELLKRGMSSEEIVKELLK